MLSFPETIVQHLHNNNIKKIAKIFQWHLIAHSKFISEMIQMNQFCMSYASYQYCGWKNSNNPSTEVLNNT